MAISRRVTCINKTDRQSRHERISHIGGDWGKVTQSEAINQILNGTYHYYVLVNGYSTDVIVEENFLGHKYLKTVADTTIVDNLLSLTECH